jgi:hypothetical protein
MGVVHEFWDHFVFGPYLASPWGTLRSKTLTSCLVYCDFVGVVRLARLLLFLRMKGTPFQSTKPKGSGRMSGGATRLSEVGGETYGKG